MIFRERYEIEVLAGCVVGHIDPVRKEFCPYEPGDSGEREAAIADVKSKLAIYDDILQNLRRELGNKPHHQMAATKEMRDAGRRLRKMLKVT